MGERLLVIVTNKKMVYKNENFTFCDALKRRICGEKSPAPIATVMGGRRRRLGSAVVIVVAVGEGVVTCVPIVSQ